MRPTQDRKRTVLFVFGLLFGLTCSVAMGERDECRLDQFDQIGLRAHLSPTVLEATALERFKYFKPKSARGGDGQAKSTYSVLFQIKRIFKYEDRMFDEPDTRSWTAAADATMPNNETYFYISNQNDLSDDVNLNSFFLVENFMSTISSSYSNETNFHNCKAINIQMNKNYYMFIDAQDTSIKLKDRRVFTYPIR